MSGSSPRRVVVVGHGPAGRAAMARLPGAVLVAPPRARAWHAEPGRLWVEGDGRVWAEPYDALLLCADEPLLLVALGCAFAGRAPVLDARGATSVAGVYAAGIIAGATTPDEAACQAGIAADALLSGHVAPTVHSAGPDAASASPVVRLDPVDVAAILEQPAGPTRDAALLAQCALLGPILPARPVSLAALAAFAGTRPASLPPQRDDEP